MAQRENLRWLSRFPSSKNAYAIMHADEDGLGAAFATETVQALLTCFSCFVVCLSFLCSPVAAYTGFTMIFDVCTIQSVFRIAPFS